MSLHRKRFLKINWFNNWLMFSDVIMELLSELDSYGGFGINKIEAV